MYRFLGHLIKTANPLYEMPFVTNPVDVSREVMEQRKKKIFEEFMTRDFFRLSDDSATRSNTVAEIVIEIKEVDEEKSEEIVE